MTTISILGCVFLEGFLYLYVHAVLIFQMSLISQITDKGGSAKAK